MSASQAVQGKEAPYYYVPGESPHPVRTSMSLLLTFVGAALWVNDYTAGYVMFLLGIGCLFMSLYFWFREAIHESEAGLYSKRVDSAFRWSMAWFIFSEIMFFAAFFSTLWYLREVTTPWLSNLDHQTLLWPDFSGVWPNRGPAGVVEEFKTVGPFWLPTINTALLLTSGLTLTIAHHALRASKRSVATFWLAATVALGIAFIACQSYEYMHAYRDLNLRFDSGAFGSIFYMLTGFHGFHVILGTVFLAVILLRMMRGHFTESNHFGFEGAAWYWHFVDVVWLGLYLYVYWF